jgi:hypothetical protein
MSELRREVEQIDRFELHRMPDGSEVYYEPERHGYFGEIKPKKGGGYSYVRDSRLTGVSTPVKALDTNVDPLLYWAAKLDQTGIAELASACLDSDATMELDWLRSQSSIAAALRDAELTWSHVRDRAAQRGTNVHELIFLALAQDRRPPSLSALSAEERAYGQAAMRWWRDRQPEPLYAEQVTLCRSHGVAGRFDLLCDIDGTRVLVDAKTREKGVARKGDHAQLAGYEMCNEACGIGPSNAQIALILKPDGTYEEHEGVGTEDDFLCALHAYRAGGDLDKRMRAAQKAEREAVAA